MLSTAFHRSRIFDPESLGRWDRDTVRKVGMVTGCLLLVPRPLWEELGGFDERFWMYSEDADLSIRARALGYSPMISPDATITHSVGAASSSMSSRRLLTMRGQVTLIDKHWPRRRAQAGRLLILTGVAVRASVASVLRRPSPWRSVWQQRASWIGGWPADLMVEPVGSEPNRSL